MIGYSSESFMSMTLDYTLIETSKDLQNFYETNKNVEWLALDTEFIGERRFETLLCLIQVATPDRKSVV